MKSDINQFIHSTIGIVLSVLLLLSMLPVVASAQDENLCPVPLTTNDDGAAIENDRTGISGICIGCSVANTGNVIDDDASNFGVITMLAGIGASGSIAVNTGSEKAAGTVFGFAVEDASTIGLLGAGLLNDIQIQTFLNGSLREAFSADSALVNVILLNPSTVNFLTLTATTSFDEIRITLSGVELLTNLNVYYAFTEMTTECPTDVSISKMVDPVGPVLSGSDITYTLTINNSADDVARDVIVTDTLPAGLTNLSASNSFGVDNPVLMAGSAVDWNLGDLEADSSGTITITANAPSTIGLITNSVVVSSDSDNNAANNSDSVDLLLIIGDGDGDNIPDDGTDLCPGTTLGLAVDANGCPTAQAIFDASDDPADGGFDGQDLDDVGLFDIVDALIDLYEVGFTDPVSVGAPDYAVAGMPTAMELQAVIDAINSSDVDGDGLSESEEVLLGTDPDDPDSDSVFTTPEDENDNGISDALEDFDGDGVSNIQEINSGTDPFDPNDPLPGGGDDDNNNGTPDGQEDPDGDGLTNGEEAILGTDPNDADSDSSLTVPNEANNNTDDGDEDFDNDGVSNLVELNQGTDPLNSDEPWPGGGNDGNNNGIPDGQEDPDGDGLTNGEEAILGTDPNDADSDSSLTVPDEADNGINDALEDFDGDGISNGSELNAGTDPFDPNDPLPGGDGDSNNDNTPDGEEDPDNDRLSNSEEATLGTDPNDADSDSSKTTPDESGNDISDALEDFDNDGVSNVQEFNGGSDPFNANDPLPGGGSDANNNGIPDGQEDPDGDNVNNGEEASIGTDAVDADSDSSKTAPDENDNTINDGVEDFDQDGISNVQELYSGTDPFDSDDPMEGAGDDANNNGIPDGQEDPDDDGFSSGEDFVLGTDPNDGDSDSTLTPDVNEANNFIKDGDEDFDNDGDINSFELLKGTNPFDSTSGTSTGSIFSDQFED